MLKENGCLSFIIPSTLLFQAEFLKTRELLISNFTIVDILNLGDKVFEDAAVPTCIIVIKKKQNSNYTFTYRDIRNVDSLVDSILEGKSVSFNSIDILNTPNLIFGINVKGIILIDKIIKNSRPLSDFVTDVSYGVSSGADKVFKVSKELTCTKKLEKEYVKPVLSGQDIGKYSIDYQNNYIIYTSKNINLEDTPNIKSYLNANKEKLGKNIDLNNILKPIYQLHRARKVELFSSDKLLIRQTGDKITSTIDGIGYFTMDSVMNVHLKDKSQNKYVLALLNSKLLNFIYQSITQEVGRAFAQVKPTNIRRLPIPKATPEEQEKLATMVDKIMALKADLRSREQGVKSFLKDNYGLEIKKTLPEYTDLVSKLSNLTMTQKEELHSWYTTKKTELLAIENEANSVDNQIDQEVYRLYGLTSEEVKIIEKS